MVARIVKEHGFSEVAASAVLDEALVFMHLAANNPGSGLGPSPLVDIGWHTFILYTREYTDYCQAAFGRYLHHSPFNAEEQATIARPVADTVKFMAEHGITYDADLWRIRTAECTDGESACKTGECTADPDTALVMADCTGDCDNGGYGGGSACRGQCS